MDRNDSADEGVNGMFSWRVVGGWGVVVVICLVGLVSWLVLVLVEAEGKGLEWGGTVWFWICGVGGEGGCVSLFFWGGSGGGGGFTEGLVVDWLIGWLADGGFGGGCLPLFFYFRGGFF